jgi:hypothetical protein
MIKESLDRGWFFTLSDLRLVGAERGRGADRKRYGDAVISVTLKSSRYDNLLTGSLAALPVINRGPLDARFGAAAVTEALLRVEASLQASLAGENKSTSAHVYAPVVDASGETIPGCKVYVGGGDPSDPRSPVPGTLYVQGVRVAQRVTTPAPNGPGPPAKSSPVVAATAAIRATLPIGAWRQYRLLPGDAGEFTVSAEGQRWRYAETLALTPPELAGILVGGDTDDDEE